MILSLYFVYVAARLSCLGYVISDLIFDTSVNLHINCERMFAAIDRLGALTAITLGSNLCLISEVSEWSSVPFPVVAVHDTLVFLAVGIRLSYFGHMGYDDTNCRSHWRTFFRGSSMPSLSRALLQNGQLYYLVTIGSSVA
ncbi:hypothetical protein ABKN59_010476 [Abortiporus biennis]